MLKKHRNGPALRHILLTGLALAPLLAAGCGGDSGSVDAAPPTITRADTGITTNPATLTSQGGTATILVDVTDASGVNASSVKADVTKAGQSITGGPQTMISLNSVQNRYGYSVTLSASSSATANDVYTVTVTASDTLGNTVNPGFVVGTITVPHP